MLLSQNPSLFVQECSKSCQKLFYLLFYSSRGFPFTRLLKSFVRSFTMLSTRFARSITRPSTRLAHSISRLSKRFARSFTRLSTRFVRSYPRLLTLFGHFLPFRVVSDTSRSIQSIYNDFTLKSCYRLWRLMVRDGSVEALFSNNEAKYRLLALSDSLFSTDFKNILEK